VRLLLDTHTLIWAVSDPDKLSTLVKKLIVNPSNSVFVSAASAWEIGIKMALGKLDFPLERLRLVMRDTGFVELPVSIHHATLVRGLPPFHKDPFDRMLIAQAIAEQMIILTRDPIFREYPVPSHWDA
jgi:PIN domain nuclease of toxin-antitoxin system